MADQCQYCTAATGKIVKRGYALYPRSGSRCLVGIWTTVRLVLCSIPRAFHGNTLLLTIRAVLVIDTGCGFFLCREPSYLHGGIVLDIAVAFCRKACLYRISHSVGCWSRDSFPFCCRSGRFDSVLSLCDVLGWVDIDCWSPVCSGTLFTVGVVDPCGIDCHYRWFGHFFWVHICGLVCFAAYWFAFPGGTVSTA